MSEVTLCTFNCRGLGDFRKRRDVLNYLKKSPHNIFFLQDIHCSPGKKHSFRNTWGSDILISSLSGNARGVAILTKSVEVDFKETYIDNSGNYIVARTLINKTLDVILVNTYGPNRDDPDFFTKVQEICKEEKRERRRDSNNLGRRLKYNIML